MNVTNIRRIMVMVMVMVIITVITTVKAVNKEQISLRDFSVNLWTVVEVDMEM